MKTLGDFDSLLDSLLDETDYQLDVQIVPTVPISDLMLLEYSLDPAIIMDVMMAVEPNPDELLLKFPSVLIQALCFCWEDFGMRP